MFEKFISTDVRQFRQHLPVTNESVTNKWSALLPTHIVESSTVLDLGCANGAAGYWCQTNGCKSYTGVEVQDNYYQTAKNLLSECEFIQSDAVEFLKTTDRQWEVVIAAGILHGIFNPFEVLKLLTQVATDYIIIENNETVEQGVPSIHFRKTNMVNDKDMNNPYHGYATYVGSDALQFIMNEYGWVGKRVYPKQIQNGIDPYHKKSKLHDLLPEHVHRYAYIFEKAETTKQSLEDVIKQNVGI